MVRVSLSRSGTVIAGRCEVAESFVSRLKGLIGKCALEEGEGMLFPRCNDIHMWFMSIPIDVVFLKPRPDVAGGAGASSHEVCSTREGLKPWRILPVRDGRAKDTLELPAGAVKRHGIRAGDIVCIA